MPLPKLTPATDLDTALSAQSAFDAVVAVGPSDAFVSIGSLDAALKSLRGLDAMAGHAISLVPADNLAGGRLISAPTGPLNRDQDDVRRFQDAAVQGIRRARDAGSQRPLLIVRGAPKTPDFANSDAVALLAAAGSVWEPLEGREARGEQACEPITEIGFSLQEGREEQVGNWVHAVELGRRLSRDIGGTDPERMAPPRMAEICEQAFAGTSVKINVISDRATIDREYPLASAVGRCSYGVERHHPRIIRLEYTPKGKVEETLLFAGKGLSYDTGGADLKVGGSMAGMSRDKCGGATVAGFLRTIAELAPTNLRVIAEIGCVRNSIGADAFVADEIITSHGGARCRIGNTDAEGRLVLADLLSHLREDAQTAINPRLFTVATLTGHSFRAVGPYSIALDNRPARDAGIADTLSRVGDLFGDPFDISRLRREDWEFVGPKSKADDTLTCNNGPSTQTPRGHQFPMAFLSIAAGLDRHGPDSDQPLPFTHIDVGGSSAEGGDWQHGRPTSAPLAAFAGAWLPIAK